MKIENLTENYAVKRIRKKQVQLRMQWWLWISQSKRVLRGGTRLEKPLIISKFYRWWVDSSLHNSRQISFFFTQIFHETWIIIVITFENTFIVRATILAWRSRHRFSAYKKSCGKKNTHLVKKIISFGKVWKIWTKMIFK